MTGLDIAYEETERRSFFRFNLTAIVLTLGAIAGGIIAILLIAVGPAAVEFVGLSGTVKWLILLLDWPLLALLVLSDLQCSIGSHPTENSRIGAGIHRAPSLLWSCGYRLGCLHGLRV